MKNQLLRTMRTLGFACLGMFVVFIVLAYVLDYYGGQRKFAALCDTQAGARVVQRLEKNAGWTVDQPYDGKRRDDFRRPFSFGHVAFVRVPNRKGEWFDAVPDALHPGEFVMTPADAARPVRYRYRYERLSFSDDERFGGSRENIIDLASGKSVASFTIIYYEWARPEDMILHAPTSQSCKRASDSHETFYRALYAGSGDQ